MNNSVDIKILKSGDIQNIFGISKNQAYALMHSSGFPSITINNRIYVEEDSLRKWIKENTGRKYIIE